MAAAKGWGRPPRRIPAPSLAALALAALAGGGASASTSASAFAVIPAVRRPAAPGTALAMGLWGGGGGEGGSGGGRSRPALSILAEVGAGSYGTVHLGRVGGKDGPYRICKRAWTEEELRDLAANNARRATERLARSEEYADATQPHRVALRAQANDLALDGDRIRDKAQRCRHYLDVEAHCAARAGAAAGGGEGEGEGTAAPAAAAAAAAAASCVPGYFGRYRDDGEAGGHEWLVFDLIEATEGGRPVPSADDAGASADEDAAADEEEGAAVPVPARSLAAVLELEWADQHRRDGADPGAGIHRLSALQRELGMPEGSSFADVLDGALMALLTAVSSVNAANVVHRDVKPGNLLVVGPGGDGGGDRGKGSFVLIDFGSAADLDPPPPGRGGVGWGGGGILQSGLMGGSGGRIGLEDDGRVALSPIYSAPETFVRVDRSPLNFDSFSAALVFCQLLLNLLDERADASFRQQLTDCGYDLDRWLQREMLAELQPDGIDDAVYYLADRPGLWNLLGRMLREDPERRKSTVGALHRAEKILAHARRGTMAGGKDDMALLEELDGKYFAGVVASFDYCEIPDGMLDGGAAEGGGGSRARGGARAVPEGAGEADAHEGGQAEQEEQEQDGKKRRLVLPRPLHFVATFNRAMPLGLLLSEVDPDDEYEDEEELDEKAAAAWKEATTSSFPGEVYIRGIVPGSQADDIGIFNVGDQLQGVGEFPFLAEGFSTAVEMLQRQPPSAKSVTLHFKRASIGRKHEYERAPPHRAKVVGQGAWSSRGRRKSQEDRFILTEIRDGPNAALLSGVFDGHGGGAASKTLAQLLPSLFSVELSDLANDREGKVASQSDVLAALETAFDLTCSTYRDGCDAEGTCVADYDPSEGVVLAGTGSADLVAGSTATATVLSTAEDGADALTVLNCGDSRTLVVGRRRGAGEGDGGGGAGGDADVVHFATRDHFPGDPLEIERLARGKDKGFSEAKCNMSRWRVKVGDYQYALSRSMEGSFATSKGIVSEADMSVVDLSELLAERELGAVIQASDGLFDVIDNEEFGRRVVEAREKGHPAEEVAKSICQMAIEKGSPDNVSVVIIYLD